MAKLWRASGHSPSSPSFRLIRIRSLFGGEPDVPFFLWRRIVEHFEKPNSRFHPKVLAQVGLSPFFEARSPAEGKSPRNRRTESSGAVANSLRIKGGNVPSLPFSGGESILRVVWKSRWSCPLFFFLARKSQRHFANSALFFFPPLQGRHSPDAARQAIVAALSFLLWAG